MSLPDTKRKRNTRLCNGEKTLENSKNGLMARCLWEACHGTRNELKMCRAFHNTRARVRALAAVCCLGVALTACGGAPKAAGSLDADAAQTTADGAQSAPTAAQTVPSDAPLTLVMDNREMPLDGEAGFYTVESPRFDETCNIMFYDYAKMQQRYLCADAACAHDTPDCTSFVDAQLGATTCFTAGGKLYLCYNAPRETIEENNLQQSILEQRELDGTNAKLVAQSSAFQAFEGRGIVFTDGAAVYTPRDSAGGTLTRTDLTTGEIKILPWNQDCIPIDAADGRKIFSIRRESTNNAPAAPTTLYATNVDTGETTAMHSWPAGVFGYLEASVKDGKLYYVNLTSRVITAYDLATGEETPVTDAFVQYGEPYERNYAAEGFGAEEAALMQQQSPIEYPAAMWGGKILGDWMIVTLDSPQPSRRYAYNMQTAEVKELTLMDYYNGDEYFLAPHALTPHGLVVTQEHRFVTVHTSHDGVPSTYEATYEVYGFMDMEDYLSSNPNFRTIQPVEYKSA